MVDVDGVEKTVQDHVEGSMFPNWDGQVQKRFFARSDNLLTLSTPPLAYGEKNAVGVLIWEKIE